MGNVSNWKKFYWKSDRSIWFLLNFKNERKLFWYWYKIIRNDGWLNFIFIWRFYVLKADKFGKYVL